jgi:hypothetical protein
MPVRSAPPSADQRYQNAYLFGAICPRLGRGVASCCPANIRANWLSNSVFEDYQAILDAGCDARNKLAANPPTIMSIGLRDWAHAGQ